MRTRKSLPLVACARLALALFCTASALFAVASPAFAVLYGPDLPRAEADRPDQVSGSQIHLIYVIPSDGDDRSLDTDGTLKNTFSSFQTWLQGKAGGRFFRADTYQGSLDVSFFQLSRDDATIASYGAFVRDEIEKETKAAGFNAPNKIYAVYYDGTSTWSCGGGAWPPTLVGNVTALYLNGLPDSPNPCSSNTFAGPGDNPTYWEFSMLHEIMHTLGFVASCAPNHHRAGHVSDNPDDLMWAGDGYWFPSGYANAVLDAGNNDYYKHNNAGCLDLDDSPYLVGPTAVRVTSFYAQRAGQAVKLLWRTGSESDLLGFNIYRQQNGKTVKLNRSLLPSVFGGTTTGHTYSWLDRTARSRTPSTYRLQAVSLRGRLTWLGTAATGQ